MDGIVWIWGFKISSFGGRALIAGFDETIRGWGNPAIGARPPNSGRRYHGFTVSSTLSFLPIWTLKF